MKVIMNDDQQSKREEALGRTLQQIEKAYGKGSIMQMDQMTTDVEGISTGILSLDLALGGRGLPRGRIVETFGPEASGKTTLALSAIASAQQAGGIAAMIDVEHALDPGWAKKCGVNLGQLLVSQPESGEEALEITEMLVRSGAVDLLVLDSVAALIPRAEIEGEMGDTHVALQARLMSQALRKLTAAIGKTRTIVMFINQIRMKIGVMFGNPETTPGGRALKFYTSIRLDIRRIAAIKEGDVVTGSHVRVKVVKNKVAAPFREAEFDIMFDSGVSIEGDLIDLGVTDDIVIKSGAWFSYKGVRLGQGRENAKQFLRDNSDLSDEIRKAIVAKRMPTVAAEDKAGTKPGESESSASGAKQPTAAKSTMRVVGSKRKRA